MAKAKIKSILFVEDEKQMHSLLFSALSYFSNEVYSAENGIEALEIVDKHKPVVIISDMKMPQMNGIELCQEIKKKNPEQYFIFLTAFNEENFLNQAIKLNVDGYLIKPLDINNLKSILDDISERIYLKEQLLLKEEIQNKYDLLENIFNGINDSICIVDDNCNILLLNEKAKSLSNMKNSSNLNNQSLEATVKEVIETGKQSTKIYNSSDINKNDLVEEVTITPLKNVNGKTYGFLEHRKDLSEFKKFQDEVYHYEHYDKLTNLFNTKSFYKKLENAIEDAKKNSLNCALIILDIDNLKSLNDSFGLTFGDEVLKKFVFWINSFLEKKHTFARLNSDNFAIILENIKNKEEIVNLIKKMNKKVNSELIEVFYNNIHITFSSGISIFPDDGDCTDVLVKNATNALHSVKKDGKNNFRFYNNSLTQTIMDKVVLESFLKDAVLKETFELYYQPQINSLNNSLTGVEVLIRWLSSPLGFISPAEFIPILEDLGLIEKVGYWIIETIFKKCEYWNSCNYDYGIISINISIKQLENSNEFIAFLKRLIKETNCDTKKIGFEVTESMLIKNHEKMIKTLEEIADLGFYLSIDDFGTGYSSLSRLKKMPINKLKIDKSFVDGIPFDKDDIVLTKTIIDLAKNMNLKIIAEGVETKEQLDFLIKHNCNEIQGYYFSKPLNEEHFLRFINANV